MGAESAVCQEKESSWTVIKVVESCVAEPQARATGTIGKTWGSLSFPPGLCGGFSLH